MRVEHEICMCQTPVHSVQAIKLLLSWQGGQGRSKSALEWPKFGFGAVRRSPNGSMAPAMDPKWSAQLPLIDLSQFPDLLKHNSPYIYI